MVTFYPDVYLRQAISAHEKLSNILYKGFKRTVEPDPEQAIMPLNLLKGHCRIPTDLADDDDLLGLYMRVAEKMVENFSGVCFRAQTWEFWLQRLPSDGHGVGRMGRVLRLEKTPISAINWIKYYDTEDVLQTLSTNSYNYVLEALPPLVNFVPDMAVPLCNGIQRIDQWRVNFLAGDANTEGWTGIEETAQLAIGMLVGHWYRNREAVGTVPKVLQLSFVDMINSISWRTYP